MKLTTQQVYAVTALNHAVRLLSKAYTPEFFEYLEHIGALPVSDLADVEGELDHLLQEGGFE